MFRTRYRRFDGNDGRKLVKMAKLISLYMIFVIKFIQKYTTTFEMTCDKLQSIRKKKSTSSPKREMKNRYCGAMSVYIPGRSYQPVTVDLEETDCHLDSRETGCASINSRIVARLDNTSFRRAAIRRADSFP